VRVLPELVGGWGYVAAALAFVAAIGILVASHRRYLRRVPAGGVLIGLTALAVLVVGVAAGVITLGSSLSRP
jgi:hypothetical protein